MLKKKSGAFKNISELATEIGLMDKNIRRITSCAEILGKKI